MAATKKMKQNDAIVSRIDYLEEKKIEKFSSIYISKSYWFNNKY